MSYLRTITTRRVFTLSIALISTLILPLFACSQSQSRYEQLQALMQQRQKLTVTLINQKLQGQQTSSIQFIKKKQLDLNLKYLYRL